MRIARSLRAFDATHDLDGRGEVTLEFYGFWFQSYFFSVILSSFILAGEVVWNRNTGN